MDTLQEIIPVFKILCREFFPEILNSQGLMNEGAEIGVQKGYFSKNILDVWKGKKLYSIDPWKEFSSQNYVDVANVSQKEHDENFEATQKLLQPYGDRSQIIRSTSDEAVALFQNESLDFAYLDAQHHYEAVAHDISLWWPKIKRLGILAGHDYIPDGHYPDYGDFGVQKAVNEFIRNHNLQLILSSEKSPEGLDMSPSWFIVKP